MEIHISHQVAKRMLFDFLKDETLMKDKEVIEALQGTLERLQSKNAIVSSEVGSLRIDKHCNIWISDERGEHPLQLQYLWKIVYLFLLLKKEGVNFCKLAAYKSELYVLYQLVSRDKNVDALKLNRTLDRLVEKGSNVPHEICSRIRKELKKVVPETVLPHYDIVARRGEVHAIRLDRSHVSIENERLLNLCSW